MDESQSKVVDGVAQFEFVRNKMREPGHYLYTIEVMPWLRRRE